MAYQTGTVTGVPALLDALQTFAVAQGWVVERDVADTLEPTKTGELILSKDNSDGRPIFVGFQHYYDVVLDYYNLNIISAMSYEDSEPFTNQPYALERAVTMYQLDIEYHFMVNDRRILIGYIVENTYDMLYVGRGLQYMTPDQLPYFDICSGPLTQNLATRYSGAHHNGIYQSATQGARIEANGFATTQCGFKMVGGWSAATYLNTYGGRHLYNLPIRIDVTDATKEMYYGEWEGIKGICGVALTAGSTFTIGSSNYIVFPDRGFNAVNDYFALELK